MPFQWPKMHFQVETTITFSCQPWTQAAVVNGYWWVIFFLFELSFKDLLWHQYQLCLKGLCSLFFLITNAPPNFKVNVAVRMVFRYGTCQFPPERKTSAMQCTITAIRAVQYHKPETDGKNRLWTSCFSQAQFAQQSTSGPKGQYWRMAAGKHENSLTNTASHEKFPLKMYRKTLPEQERSDF